MRSLFAPPLTGRHVLMMLIAFFGIVFGVNGMLAYRALSTWTGLEQENAYMDGLNYNQTLEARRAQDALGWTNTLTAHFKDGTVDLTAQYFDRSGTPLDTLTVEAMLRRPTQEGFDQNLTLVNQGHGEYGARVPLPLAGQWQVRLTARRGDSDIFFSEARIWSR